MLKSQSLFAALALTLVLASCNQTLPQSGHPANTPVDAVTGEPIDQAFFEALKNNPNVVSYTITATANTEEGGVSKQATNTCTLYNMVHANRPGATLADANTYATCSAAFAYIDIYTIFTDDWTGAQKTKTFRDQLRSQTNAYAGTLPRVQYHRYSLASAATVGFMDGSSGSGSGPTGFDTAQ